jgi:Trk-type K+ transport system membrane component
LTALFFLIIFDLGYRAFYSEQSEILKIVQVLLTSLLLLYFARFLVTFSLPAKTRILNIILIAVAIYLSDTLSELQELSLNEQRLFTLKKTLVYSGIVVLYLIEASQLLKYVYRKGINPALLFVVSFVGMAMFGGLLLLLPNATVAGINPIDALFTSVSAVCVTGLNVIDPATSFTTFGKLIILLLIQTGAFGIMTFAGIIGYYVAGSISVQHQIALSGVLSTERLSGAVSYALKIVFVTFFFELIGGLLIYATLPADLLESEWERIFFAVFHAVSAFCNAGFSTLTDGLYDERLRYNYGLQWIVAALIILGGIGFPVVFNVFTFIRLKSVNLVKNLIGNENREVYTNILEVTSKLALVTTAILLVAGTLLYFGFEADATLASHESIWGKITTSFFGSVTPRTAGFNTVNLTDLTMPTLMIYMLFMWIGASPGSTGGGIKTTVLAVAFLNMKDILRGRKRLEVYRSEISEPSVHRAFAIMLLSLTTIAIAVLLLSIYDSEKGLLRLSFEAFSAFSTVGLTLGVTPGLSLFGKLVIMCVMLIGRIGALTLLFAIVSKSQARPYRYPKEEIMF